MRLSGIFALLALPMLGGCVESNYLVTASPAHGAVASGVDSLAPPTRTYTTHRAAPVGKPEVVRLRLDDAFVPFERAKILFAVNEWNHVLNGYVRLDIVSRPGAGLAQAWSILPARGTGPARGSSEALAVTQPLPPGGGLVIVFVDRLGSRDLGGVLLHELGHVLGLGHDPRGLLMSARYSADNQQCIDRAAAEAIASYRRLPVAVLNWCEPPLASAALAHK
jgi:hypothetical protein